MRLPPLSLTLSCSEKSCIGEIVPVPLHVREGGAFSSTLSSTFRLPPHSAILESRNTWLRCLFLACGPAGLDWIARTKGVEQEQEEEEQQQQWHGLLLLLFKLITLRGSQKSQRDFTSPIPRSSSALMRAPPARLPALGRRQT